MTKQVNDEIEKKLAGEINLILTCSRLKKENSLYLTPCEAFNKIKALITSAKKEVAERIFDDIFGIIKYLKTKPFQNMGIDDYLGTLEISIKDLQKEASCG